MLLVAALAGVATSGWVRVGEGSGPAVGVALGSLGPPALALGASALCHRAWPAWMAVLGHVGLLGAVSVLVAGGPTAAATAVSSGWARLLSTILPASSGSVVDVLALVASGAASAIGAELALRSRGALVPAVPALLALVATRMVTQGAPVSTLTGAAVVLVVLAGGLALVRVGSVRSAFGLGVVLSAALAAGLVAPGLPWAQARAPFDPRALRDVDTTGSGTVNPLSRLWAWQAEPDSLLFRVRLSEPATLRLAVLDRYDGVRFTATPRFTPAGSALPPRSDDDPGAGVPTRAVTAEVVIANLDGPWLPAPDRATRVGGPAVAVDPATGVLVVSGGVRSGMRFQLEAAVTTGGRSLAPDAPPAGTQQVGEVVGALPPTGLPRQLTDLATDMAGDPADSPLTRLERLETFFHTQFRENPTSPPGHSLARLTGLAAPADRAGSTEQLATLFAMFARSLGYPTRVVVGFRASDRGDVEVRGADAHAWPEVALAGVGWVPFDPVPERGAAPRAAGDSREGPVAAPTATTVQPPKPVPPPPPAVDGPDRSWRPPWVAGGLVVAGLAVALAAIVAFKRRRRSVRRRAPDPVARVRGAWAEAVDRLVERGVRCPSSSTPRTASDAVGAVSKAAAAPLADLGDLADRAAFAGPGAVAAPDADRAWADLELLEAALDAEHGRIAALRCAVDPRPLASRR